MGILLCSLKKLGLGENPLLASAESVMMAVVRHS
jgi:hypothetical protein